MDVWEVIWRIFQQLSVKYCFWVLGGFVGFVVGVCFRAENCGKILFVEVVVG